MKITIDYGKFTLPAKREKAVQDVKDYLDDKFDIVVELTAACPSLEQVRFNLAFAGIDGYPSQAMWETYNTQGIAEAKENDNGTSQD